MRLPKRILPIVERLRAEVPKPAIGPVCLFPWVEDIDKPYPSPRWNTVFQGESRHTCAMGLLPGVESPCPGKTQVPGSRENDVEAFGEWWDSLTQDKALAAVEEIWK